MGLVTGFAELSGPVKACCAHNPEIDGSVSSSANRKTCKPTGLPTILSYPPIPTLPSFLDKQTPPATSVSIGMSAAVVKTAVLLLTDFFCYHVYMHKISFCHCSVKDNTLTEPFTYLPFILHSPVKAAFLCSMLCQVRSGPWGWDS